eukprot:jgi/Psemu1/182555/e_gw1.26.206.1
MTTTTPFKRFLFFAAFRIANVFLIQSQFDPDEYWQNLEPSYCRIFGDDPTFDKHSSCPGLTWEWKRRRQVQQEKTGSEHWSHPFTEAFAFALEGPVRSFASILPTLVFYAIIKKCRWDSSWMVSRGPLFINAVFIAATTDWTIWYSSRWMKSRTRGETGKTESDERTDVVFWGVFCSLSSWFNAYTLVRTYSNSLETALVAISFALISSEFLSENETTSISKSSLARAWTAFFIGGICVSIRFTCLTAYIPMGVILARETKTTKAMISYLFGICAFAGLLGFALTVLLDRAMFGVWAMPVLGNFHFNVIQGNGSLYGTHPFHWYLTAGIPALTGILFPVLVYDLLFASWSRATRNLWTIVACYVLAHSASEHKELRFILPILPLISLLCGARIESLTRSLGPSKRNRIIMGFAGLNLIAVLYLGLVHQRAPIDVNRAILSAAHATQTSPLDPIEVHYLMGCHSTPLLSHLHAPPTKFLPWYLDCSPNCRADPATDCESDTFSKDPDGFLQRTYFDCNGEQRMDATCTETMDERNISGIRNIPDFVVCYSDDMRRMRNTLNMIGMKEIGRFVQGVNGIQIGDLSFGSESFRDPDATTFGLDKIFVLGFEEMILLQKTS